MVQDIPPDSWVHGQDLQEGKEFKPEFDYLDPKKPYVIGLFEWLIMNGLRTCKIGLLTGATQETTVYTVPAGYVWFVTSCDLTVNDTGSGNSGICRIDFNGTTQSLIQCWANSNDVMTLTKGFYPPMIVRSGERLRLQKSAAVASKDCLGGVQGYLVLNDKIKEEALK